MLAPLARFIDWSALQLVYAVAPLKQVPESEIWRLPCGHLSMGFELGLMGRVLHWLAPRLEVGRKDNVVQTRTTK